MKTTSAVLNSSTVEGDGSKVWELVPSGTMPMISARSPMMFAAIEVIGATVVTTRSLPSAASSEDESEPSLLPHETATRLARTASAVERETEERNIEITVDATCSQHDVVLEL